MALAVVGFAPEVVATLGGIILVSLLVLFRAKPDAVAYWMVGLLVLTISWNGIRFAGGAIGDAVMAVAFVAVIAYLVLERRALTLPPWLLLTGLGFLIAALLVMILPPSNSLLERTQLQRATLEAQAGGALLVTPRSDLLALAEFELSSMLIPIMLLATATTPKRCKRLLDLWALSGAVCAFVAVLDYTGVAHLSPYPLIGSRSSGLTIHPNYLALTCDITLPAVLLWFGRSRAWTMAGLAASASLLGGEYASGSRAGAAAIVLAGVATVVCIPRLRVGLVRILPLLGMTLLPLLLFTHTGRHLLAQIRLNGTLNTSGSDFDRRSLAQIAIAQFQARPVQGVGFAEIEDAHNIYLQLLSAGGLIALTSFAVFCGGLLKALRRSLFGPNRDLALAAGISVITWLVNGLFDSQVADKYLYVMPGLLLAISAVRAAQQSRSAPADESPVRVYRRPSRTRTLTPGRAAPSRV
jgi:O-antigen ligase